MTTESRNVKLVTPPSPSNRPSSSSTGSANPESINNLSSLNLNDKVTSTGSDNKDKDTPLGSSRSRPTSASTTSSSVLSTSPNGTSSDTPPPLPKLKVILPVLTACVHTPCYCEENIWLLCDKIRSEYPTELEFCKVVFVSNSRRMVPLWRQKTGKTEDKLVIWDYHVILFYNPDDRCVVYDLDSDLPFPTHFHTYVTETFRTENILQPEYHRFFRLVHASDFLRLFSSDRTHMVKDDGTYVHPPPPYPPIVKKGVNNLEEFLDMTTTREKTEFGEILTLKDLVGRFFKPKRPT